MQAENQWIEDAIEPIFTDCVLARGANELSLALPGINAVELPVARRIIRKAIMSVKQDLRRITFLHVETVIELAQKAKACGSLNLPEGLRVIKGAGVLTFKKVKPETSAEVVEYLYTLTGEGTTLIKEADATIKLGRKPADRMVPIIGAAIQRVHGAGIGMAARQTVPGSNRYL